MLIQRFDKKIISFLIQFKNERLTEIFIDCQMPGFMILLTWVKVFLIDMEFQFGEVSRGHFCKSRKSEEKLLGGWGAR